MTLNAKMLASHERGRQRSKAVDTLRKEKRAAMQAALEKAGQPESEDEPTTNEGADAQQEG